MTDFQQRIFVAVDEWLGIALLLYLHRVQDSAFWPAFGAWFFCVYVVSYPAHWKWWKRVWRWLA